MQLSSQRAGAVDCAIERAGVPKVIRRTALSDSHDWLASDLTRFGDIILSIFAGSAKFLRSYYQTYR